MPPHSVTGFKRNKPAPDIFLAAAAGLGLSPAECVVIGETCAGMCSCDHHAARCLPLESPSCHSHMHATPPPCLHTCPPYHLPPATEDAPAGIAAARAAGMRVIGVTTTLSADEMAAEGPDTIYGHIGEISVDDIVGTRDTQNAAAAAGRQ